MDSSFPRILGFGGIYTYIYIYIYVFTCIYRFYISLSLYIYIYIHIYNRNNFELHAQSYAYITYPAGLPRIAGSGKTAKQPGRALGEPKSRQPAGLVAGCSGKDVGCREFPTICNTCSMGKPQFFKGKSQFFIGKSHFLMGTSQNFYGKITRDFYGGLMVIYLLVSSNMAGTSPN